MPRAVSLLPVVVPSMRRKRGPLPNGAASPAAGGVGRTGNGRSPDGLAGLIVAMQLCWVVATPQHSRPSELAALHGDAPLRGTSSHSASMACWIVATQLCWIIATPQHPRPFELVALHGDARPL